MILESLLAYLHLVAIFTMVVFMASEAALCRTEWMSAAVVHRLVRLDLIYGIAALCVLCHSKKPLHGRIKVSAADRMLIERLRAVQRLRAEGVR